MSDYPKNHGTLSRRQVLAGTSLMAVSACAPHPVFDVTEFGADHTASTLSTAAIQSAIDACARAGGGLVYLPAGEYRSGTLVLRSNVSMYLEAGAMLKSSSDRQDFAEFGALVYAEGATNVGVGGSGTLHGNHEAYVWLDDDGRYRGGPTGMGKHDPEPRASSSIRGRPRTIMFVDCERVSLRDVHLKDGATWTVHLLGCRDVLLDGLSIDNNLHIPNNDAVDIDHCQRVRVSNCDISAGDDALCFKTTAPATGMGPCEDIVVSNCNLRSRSSAIKLGSAGLEPIRNLLVSNCTIRDSNRGITVQNRDGGVWEDLIFSQLIIETRHFEWHRWGASEPVHVSNLQRVQGQQAGDGCVRGVVFRDLICRSEAGAHLYADPVGSVTDVSLRNVRIHLLPPRGERHGFQDLRPSYKHKQQTPLPLSGINATGVHGLSLQDLDIRFDTNAGGRKLRLEKTTQRSDSS